MSLPLHLKFWVEIENFVSEFTKSGRRGGAFTNKQIGESGESYPWTHLWMSAYYEQRQRYKRYLSFIVYMPKNNNKNLFHHYSHPSISVSNGKW
jgi:hypothetical protein